ncbi:MAG: uridylate kinase [Methanoregulaceae archaeon]
MMKIRNDSFSLLVVKIGGSLFDIAEKLVPALRSSERPLLIVPGGGAFADTIRSLRLDEDTAHWMAITAMEQSGWLLHSLGLPITDMLRIPEEPTVLLPYCVLRDADPLPHTWDVTSDTIAAWVAGSLGTDLLLIKSVDGIISGDKLYPAISMPIPTNTVDPFLLPFILERRIRTSILNGRAEGRLAAFLRGDDVPCTVIETA